jgi:phosphoglycerol transferase
MRQVRHLGEAANAALAAVLSLLFGLIVIQPWDGDLDVPYANAGDANFYRSEVKGILEHGWFWRNPDVGAPEGQQLFDYPGLSGDPLNVLVMKFIGLFTSDAAVVVNVFFLLTFPLVGLAAYLVLRRLTVSVPASIACSILYTILPYHFVRGEAHLLLSAYYVVPLGAYLVLAILGDRPLFARWRLTLATVGICGVIAFASGGYYYAAFTVILVTAVAVIRAVVSRSTTPLLQGGAVVGVILAFSLVTLAPSLVYWAKHGRNDEVAHRLPVETELYGLKLTQLVLPIERHRIERLGELRREYDDGSPKTEATFATPLGLVATAGFLFLLAVSILQIASPGRPVASPLYGHAGLATLLALLFSWTGGLSTWIAAVWPQIRAWNRLSVFIGFFALLAVGLLLDRALQALRPRAGGAILGAGIFLLVLAIGALDQTTTAYKPAYGPIEAEYRSDGDFVSAIEERLPAGAMVFQLPYHPFPETIGRERMVDYDHMRGYLHSRDLRWSYGFMKGRRGDPSPFIAEAEGRELVRLARQAGYAGIYIDRFGYEDNAASLEQGLTTAVGEAPLVSPNGRLSFFELPG